LDLFQFQEQVQRGVIYREISVLGPFAADVKDLPVTVMRVALSYFLPAEAQQGAEG
jgi:hypothetical protein